MLPYTVTTNLPPRPEPPFIATLARCAFWTMLALHVLPAVLAPFEGVLR